MFQRILTLLIIVFVGAAAAPPSIQAPARPEVPDGRVLPCRESELSREMLSRAARYLWSQQGADGGFHSPQYGLLRSGQALTPFVLQALLQVPDSICAPPAGAVERARQFLREHVNADGALGFSDPEVVEYPNYATALAMLCLLGSQRPQDHRLVRRMATYLSAQQYCEERGFDRSHPAYGGFGYGGRCQPGETGHMDLAHTRVVLEALRAAGLPNDDVVFRRAEHFLRYVQKHPDDERLQPAVRPGGPRGHAPFDGGFYFSPVVPVANKGRTATDPLTGIEYFSSYASATCDGILSLRACGCATGDSRIQAAVDWLARYPQLDYPAGIPRDHPEPWGEAVFFYHLAIRARTLAAVQQPGPWRATVIQLLAARQKPDGHFINERSPLMKEDDPVLCTALAVTALRATQPDAATAPSGNE